MSANQTALRVLTIVDGDRVTASFPAETALTETNAEELQRALGELVEGRERPHLVVDLSGVTVLTSVILSKFITLNKRVRAADGRFVLTNPTPTVFMVFKVTKLDTVLDIQTGGSDLPA